MKGLYALAFLCLGACGVASGERNRISKSERETFVNELSFLTYRSQCPDVTPLILGKERAEVEKMKSDLAVRIINSPLKADYDASVMRMEKENEGLNEADCVGTPYADDDQDALKSARAGFIHDKAQILTIDTHFQTLLKRVAV